MTFGKKRNTLSVEVETHKNIKSDSSCVWKGELKGMYMDELIKKVNNGYKDSSEENEKDGE